MAESFVNEYTTALSGSLTDSATNFTVMHDVPSGLTADFRVRVDNEFMTVTGISGSGNRDWTVTRESEESSRFPAAAHNAGATVAHVWTAGAVVGTHGARVYLSSAQNLNNGSPTTLLFASELFDTNGYHDTGSNTSRLTIPTGLGGIYMIGGTVGITANGTGYRSLLFQVDGGDYIGRTLYPSVGSVTAANLTCNVPYYLAAGQYVEMVVTVNTASLQALASDYYQTHFWVYRLGVY